MSTSGGYHEYIEGYHEYIGGISWVHRGDTMSTSGGYHEYIGECSVHRGDIMMHVGEKVDISLSIYIENSDVLNISRCTHDIPHMHHDPPMYWTSPDVLMIFPTCIIISTRCTEHPRCTYGIPPHASWYPPHASWYSPDVLNIHCTGWRCRPYCVIILLPDVLMIFPTCIIISTRCTEHPRCTYGIPPHASWYPQHASWYRPDVLNIHRTGWRCRPYGVIVLLSDVLMIFPTCIIISTRCTEHPWCTYGIPPHASWYPQHASWYSPNVLNIHCTGWRCRPYGVIVILSDVLMIFPTCIIMSTRCTEHPWCTYGIPPHASWYPQHASWYSPDVLNIHCIGWRCRPYCVIVLLLDVLMIFPTCIIISTRCTEHPRCTYGIPPHASWYPQHASWYSPDQLNIHCTGWRCSPYCIIVLLPNVLMIFPTCIIISTRCTEHTL